MGWELLEFPSYHLIIPAMVASLVTIVNVPLAAILFVTEAFGGIWMVPALVTMVVANIFAYNSSIYRTQREEYETRQILPGYSVHRLPVPEKWQNETLKSLNIGRVFNVNVIGWVEHEAEDGLPHVRLEADADLPLTQDDILVVLGKDEDLKQLESVAASDEIMPEVADEAAEVNQSDKKQEKEESEIADAAQNDGLDGDEDSLANGPEDTLEDISEDEA